MAVCPRGGLSRLWFVDRMQREVSWFGQVRCVAGYSENCRSSRLSWRCEDGNVPDPDSWLRNINAVPCVTCINRCSIADRDPSGLLWWRFHRVELPRGEECSTGARSDQRRQGGAAIMWNGRVSGRAAADLARPARKCGHHSFARYGNRKLLWAYKPRWPYFCTEDCGSGL